MKKIILILPLLLVIIIIGLYVVNSESIESVNYSNVSLEEYKNKLERKDDFIMYVYKTSCGVCREMKPQINAAIEKSGAEVLALNADDEKNISVSFFKKYEIEKTPTLVFYEEGLEVDRLVGYYNEDDLLKFLQEL